MPRKSWWARLPFGVRMVAGTSALLIAIGGGAAGVATLTKDRQDPPRIVTAIGQAAQAAPHEAAGRPAPPPATVAHAPQGERRSAANDQADRTGTRAPRAAGAAEAPARPAPASTWGKSDKSTPPAGPVTTTRIDVETKAIPFRTRLVRDPEMPRGAKRVQTQGVPGEETLRYQVTLVNGQPTDRKLLDTTVTREPQHRVVAYGWARRGGPNRGGTMQGRGFHKDDACGNSLRVCVPLGRKACKNDEESALQLGGSVVVLDKDIELLDPETLEGLPGVTC